ncbi:hypothetical protein EMIT0357P_11237 [Pseudomonas marginalis]
MRAHIQPPSKTGVTGVTSVTPFTKRPVSLAFTPVTQLSDIAYTRCNAAHACNAKVSIQELWAGLSRSCLPSEFRWLRLSMRGITLLGLAFSQTQSHLRRYLEDI